MARKTLTLEKVKVLFSNVTSIDDFSKKYQVVVSLTEDQSADAEANGITIKQKEYKGEAQFQATFKTKYKPEIKAIDGKTNVDLNGGEIGRGSLINVGVSFRPWENPTKDDEGKPLTTGTAQDLAGIQILLQENGATSFTDESETDFGEGADDSDM